MHFDFETDFVARLDRRGAAPHVFYDIGAAEGSWTFHISRAARPDARFEMFEPLAELRPIYRERLAGAAGQVPNMEIHRIGLGAANTTAMFSVFVDGYSSSFIDIPEYDQIDARIMVPMRRLDDFVLEHGLLAPDVIKIDVQGFELEVLRGAENTIRAANWLLLETWLARGYGPETVLLHELIEWLEPRGFFPNGTGGFYRGPTGRLESIDVLFAAQAVRDSGLASEVWKD